ncbi:MAG: DUF1801 domain-containing protein [Acidobacteriaceae bacterium]
MPEVENDISLFSLSGRITGIHVFHGAKLPDSRQPIRTGSNKSGSVITAIHYNQRGRAENGMPTKLGTKEVDKYIAACPKEARGNLARVRAAIRATAPGATERTDYFQMPGYSYPGYDYDGMFVWFSFRKPYIRLHVRPPVIQEHSKELAGYPTTKAIVSFPMDEPIPVTLVKKLVRASLRTMKDKARKDKAR